jgi:2'-5' RNA ligase
MNMRVFFAIEFDDSIKHYIETVQNIVRENSIKGNFSHEDNFHLTLKFIGEVGEEKLTKLKYSLDSTVKQVQPFSIKFDRLGFFTKDAKKIVWIGIRNEDKGLDQLYNTLEAFLFNNGFSKDFRGYSPHITLARETVFMPGFEEKLSKIEIDPMEIRVNRVSLMESTRVNGKLKYRAIYVKEI